MPEALELKVTGMTCTGCERAITRALQQIPGVQGVMASHADNAVRVTFDPGVANAADIRTRIEALGYEVAA